MYWVTTYTVNKPLLSGASKRNFVYVGVLQSAKWRGSLFVEICLVKCVYASIYVLHSDHCCFPGV